MRRLRGFGALGVRRLRAIVQPPGAEAVRLGRGKRIALLVGLGLIAIAGGDIDSVGDIGLVLVMLGVVAVLLYLFVPSSDEHRK